jgi:toxin ParE1/3/4
MARVEFAPAAAADLNEIGEYVAADNRAAAAKLIARFKEQAASLARSPGIGRPRPEFQPRLRSFPVSRYVLFYRPVEGGIEVVRVLHGMRDIDRIFEAGEGT